MRTLAGDVPLHAEAGPQERALSGSIRPHHGEYLALGDAHLINRQDGPRASRDAQIADGDGGGTIRTITPASPDR